MAGKKHFSLFPDDYITLLKKVIHGTVNCSTSNNSLYIFLSSFGLRVVGWFERYFEHSFAFLNIIIYCLKQYVCTVENKRV